jgi:hypothetical protein
LRLTRLWAPQSLRSPDAAAHPAMEPPHPALAATAPAQSTRGRSPGCSSPLRPALLLFPTHPAPLFLPQATLNGLTGERVHGNPCQTLQPTGRGQESCGFFVAASLRVDSPCGEGHRVRVF